MGGGKWSNDYTVQTSYTVGKVVILPDATQITKTGYTFKGWYDNETFSGDILTTISLGTAEIKSYYAKWEATEVYTITYNLNDGTWTDDYIAPSTFKADQVITLPDSEKLSKADNSFAGWYSNSGFIGKVLTTIEEGTTGNKILYARWNSNHYADASNVSEVIANLPSGGLYTLFVTGEISDTTISDINTKLSKNSSVKVNLDLSGTTGLEKIKNSAFSSRTNLISIIIPEGVTLIDCYAFDGCTSLTKVVLPDSMEKINYNAFYGCNSLTNVIFPDKLKTIGERAFYGCTSLTSLTIPGSITGLGTVIFSRCNKITDVTFVDADNTTYSSSADGNLLLSKDGTILYGYMTSAENIIIPDTVTAIADDAFMDRRSLKSVTIPASVISIGKQAFYDCNSLSSITFEDTTTWYYTSNDNYTNGTQIDVTDPSSNGYNLRYGYNYADYYWYKE